MVGMLSKLVTSHPKGITGSNDVITHSYRTGWMY